MATATRKTWTEGTYKAGRAGHNCNRDFGLSRYHDGQTVTPRLHVVKVGETYFADYYWHDASNNSDHGHGCVSGDYWSVVHGLKAAGIRLA